MFLDRQLIIDGMVFGLRPEFFDRAASDFINAYAFMKEYEAQWNPYMSDLTPESDMAAAFDILVTAILKWEFHIYYRGLESEKEKQWEEFYKVVEHCMDSVIAEMIKSNTQMLSRKQMEMILKDCVLNAENQTKTELVLSHCFMVTDDNGEYFEFCHYSIYEYFFAKYLFFNASFEMRKTYLLSDKTTENLQHMYYMIFGRQKYLNQMFSKSIADCNGEPMTLSKCLELQRLEMIKIIDDPPVTLVEIYEYLPFAYKFLYRGNIYTQQQLDQIIASGDMDLTQTGWDRLDYAGALMPPMYVRGLNLCGMPLKDIRYLNKYEQLEWLDLRIKGLDSKYTEQSIEALKLLSLAKLILFTENGIICERIDSLMKEEVFSIGEVLVETPDYGEAYPKLYQLKKQAEDGEGKCCFHIMQRTGLENAKQEFKKKNSKKNSDILEAVFELEADENRLGFAKEDAEATFWTGLALVDYYLDLDWTDEDSRAYNLCGRIEPFIPIEDKELSVYFGKIYGKLLLTKKKSQKALQKLSVVYRYVENYLSEETAIEVALNLYKTKIRCKEEVSEEFIEELENRIKNLPDYQENWKYISYLEKYFVQKIIRWEKGEKAPENIREDHSYYQAAAGYYEQKLYYLVLAGRYNEAAEAADELIDYPYRTADKTMKKYKYIRDNCISEEGSQEQDFDKHRLWDNVWY